MFNSLVFASKADSLALTPADLAKAVRAAGGRDMRVKVKIEEGAAPSSAPLAQPASSSQNGDDEVTSRALANPEVKRFREVFGGEVRKVRNLKE